MCGMKTFREGNDTVILDRKKYDSFVSCICGFHLSMRGREYEAHETWNRLYTAVQRTAYLDEREKVYGGTVKKGTIAELYDTDEGYMFTDEQQKRLEVGLHRAIKHGIAEGIRKGGKALVADIERETFWQKTFAKITKEPAERTDGYLKHTKCSSDAEMGSFAKGGEVSEQGAKDAIEAIKQNEEEDSTTKIIKNIDRVFDLLNKATPDRRWSCTWDNVMESQGDIVKVDRSDGTFLLNDIRLQIPSTAHGMRETLRHKRVCRDDAEDSMRRAEVSESYRKRFREQQVRADFEKLRKWLGDSWEVSRHKINTFMHKDSHRLITVDYGLVTYWRDKHKVDEYKVAAVPPSKTSLDLLIRDEDAD